MMHSAPRAAIFVALYLLVSVASASAECAWVLWYGGAIRTADGQWAEIADYFVDAAFPTRSECEAASLRQPRNVFKRWVCLPDAVDPRGGGG
jgi:hypothetical protein